MTTLTREQLADKALEQGLEDGLELVDSRKPHPADPSYGGVLFESMNGPRWQIRNPACHQLYWHDLAMWYARELRLKTP